MRLERLDLRPERLNLRPEGSDEGGTNERTNGRTDERKPPCVLQDFVPFGAAAQKRNAANCCTKQLYEKGRCVAKKERKEEKNNNNRKKK